MTAKVVVGGGIAGLLAAEALVDAGFSVIGLEGSSQLGGRLEVGHHRIKSESTLERLKSLVDEVQVDEVTEPPMVRTKGEWEKLDPEEELTDAEGFYLAEKFWIPVGAYPKLLQRLTEKVGPLFQMRKLVTEVHAAEKKILCEDGSEHTFDHLAWCSPLRTLRGAWKGDKGPLKGLSKLPERNGGISLEVDLKEPLFSTRNTVVLPFRFKEWRLRALGFAGISATASVQWVLFLEGEILEDREEVAKCVRTLKREIAKEFPQVAELSLREKLTYLPVISGEAPLEWKTLLLTPEIAYFGPEVRLEGRDESWRNLDLTLGNYPTLKQEFDGWRNVTGQ